MATDNGRLEGENLTKSGAFIDFVKLDEGILDRMGNESKIVKFGNRQGQIRRRKLDKRPV